MSASPSPSGGGGYDPGPDDTFPYPKPFSETGKRRVAQSGSGGPGGPAGPSLALHERAKLVFNEKTKLTATTVNAAALAFLTGGPIATLLGLFAVKDWPTAALLSVVWIVTGLVLHLVARAFLENLQ